MDGGRVHTVSVPVSDRIRFAVFIPDFELKTEVARAALPTEISRQDAVYNLSRAALMTASLWSGSLDNLRVAVQDRLHQPYRFPLIPGAEQVFYTAYSLGPTRWPSAGPDLPSWPSSKGATTRSFPGGRRPAGSGADRLAGGGLRLRQPGGLGGIRRPLSHRFVTI